MRTRIWHSDWKPRWLIRCVSAALLSFMDKQERNCLRLRLHHHVVDGGELDVADMRPLVIAPAEVKPRRLGGDVLEGCVQRLHLPLGMGDEGLVALVRVHHVSAHGEIGTVELDHEAGRVDRLVFRAHDGGERLQVGVLARIVPVGLEHRDHARRGRVHETRERARARERRAHVGEVLLQRRFVLDADLAGAEGALDFGGLALGRDALQVGNGGAKLVHGSGGIVSLRAEQNSAT